METRDMQQKNIDSLGLHHQQNKLNEEMGELLIENSKNIAGADNQEEYITEIADVLNIIDQIVIALNVETEVMQIQHIKMQRQMKRNGIILE